MLTNNKDIYYKIVKVVKAKNIREAIRKEKNADITEIFAPDSLPSYLQELNEKETNQQRNRNKIKKGS